MFLLDTNIVSAVMKPRPADEVLAWLDRQETADLYLSSVTIAEIEFGIRSLPAGKRQRALTERFDLFLERGFENRIFGFGTEAAHHYAEIMSHRKKIGRPLGILDGQIAAMARANHCAVVTHDTRDFEECGIEIIDPFAGSSPAQEER